MALALQSQQGPEYEGICSVRLYDFDESSNLLSRQIVALPEDRSQPMHNQCIKREGHQWERKVSRAFTGSYMIKQDYDPPWWGTLMAKPRAFIYGSKVMPEELYLTLIHRKRLILVNRSLTLFHWQKIITKRYLRIIL